MKHHTRITQAVHPGLKGWFSRGFRVLSLVFAVVLLVTPDNGYSREPAGLPVLSISVLQFGTAHWELDHLQHRKLDQKNGYRLDLKLVANLPASRLAVTSGSVHGAVADLLWAQSRFQAGTPYLYVPFSSQIGDIVVPEASAIRSVADLAGKRIGVAGGPDSKGWVLLTKVAERQGIDLARDARVQFAAPPLLNQALKREQVDAIVTYWHFSARLRGEGGWRSAFGMADLLRALDLEPNLPVLGYVFPSEWAQQHAGLIERFARSLQQAKAELAGEPSHWQRLRPLMGQSTEAVFEALRDGFVAGTPAPLTEQRRGDLQRLLVLTGADAEALMPEALFYRSPP
ncbi:MULTISPECIES: ABC transporter substrate-binding protein [unclassified Marinobacter]|uniref:ABC transporter substrate-binding protein n=1 Tax=unclassified Marinobacter TaxID=83889 RepID=UPI001267F5BF|nr:MULTISPECIES: ABC transporter substrate-binding protein [unclassified Marinobacter]QFS88481.1 alkanesulfonate transporter substrate-binding subunit [Marinobacter sp. THAF197a]QFT52266.1 alkanesulfonate transporter substrate-binding subunit [Marinobacter sp. THAF39]